MAQLIKLENYVSRYEMDIYQYPGQFLRIKKQRWEKLQSRRERESVSGEPNIQSQDEQHLKVLKREFGEDVFFYQLRWASSTLREKSFLDPKYRFDSWLKFFLLRIPDNYLLMYHPVFRVRQAPVELDIIMISPMAVWCVTLLHGDQGNVYQGDSSRFWRKIEDGRVDKVLSPMLSNLRSYRLISQLVKKYEVEPLPMRRVILSPNCFIEYPDAPNGVEVVDCRMAQSWLAKMRNQPSPLKFKQLKTASILLRHCQTVSFER